MMADYRLTSMPDVVIYKDNSVIRRAYEVDLWATYQTWLNVSGNTPDPYVPPAPINSIPAAINIPVLQAEPDSPSTGSVIYTLATDGITYIKTSTGNVTAVSEK